MKDCCCEDGATSFIREGSSTCGVCDDYIDPDGPVVSYQQHERIAHYAEYTYAHKLVQGMDSCVVHIVNQ